MDPEPPDDGTVWALIARWWKPRFGLVRRLRFLAHAASLPLQVARWRRHRASVHARAGHRDPLEGLDLRIDAEDVVFDGDVEHYFAAGRSALQCVEQALAATTHSDPPPQVRTILDLPSGHGRVLRFLRHRFPEADIVACDIEPHAVEYCRRRFGARAKLSAADLGRLAFDVSFDLIWCGSLVTHLPGPRIEGLLGSFRRALSLGGILVFTAHGEEAAARLRRDPRAYNIGPPGAHALLADHASGNCGFAPYYGHTEYGISLTSVEWMRATLERVGLAAIHVAPAAWDHHQDVYVARRLE